MHPDTLRQLIANCRRKSARGYGFPKDWRPGSVHDPESGMCFTEAGAWEFIATLLETREWTEMELNQPRGARALMLIAPMEGATQPLYIKIELGPRNMPLARSFHYSERYKGE